MNKSESIKAGLRKGFQSDESKLVKGALDALKEKYSV